MTIEISCPQCGEEFRVRDEAAGKSFKCKLCGTTISVPDDEPDDDDGGDFERPRKKKKRRAADNRTLWPAIGLYVTGGLALLSAFVNLAMSLAMGVDVPPQFNGPGREGYILGHYAGIVILTVVDLIILTGAVNLQKRGTYSMALTGCILASIPCCSPCIICGMPFGIWGLVLLFNEDVKRTFS